MTRRSLADVLTGSLLLVAGLVLAVSAIHGTPDAVEIIGLALVGSAVAAVAHRQLRQPWLLLALVVIGDRLVAQPVAFEHKWKLPIAFGVYLLWIAAWSTPRAVITALAPVLLAVSVPLARRFPGSEPLLMSVAVLPAAAAGGLIAVVRARAARTRALLDRDQDDLDAVLTANVELRHVAEAHDAARRIARISTERLDADGAVVWLQGPGRLLCAGGHGMTPPPERDLPAGSAVERVLLTGVLAVDGDEIVLPLIGSGGVFGAVTVIGARRAPDAFMTSVLHTLGAHAGYALERLRAVESLIDARLVDPVTGVGNRLAASASLATLHPGDAVLLLSIDGLADLRETRGNERADLTLGQLGLHLRTATRAGDLVARFGDDVFFVLLRDLSASTEAVVDRLLDAWQENGAVGHIRAGAALHFRETTPLDTLDRASHALDAARRDRAAAPGA